ncbi:glycosyltransferase family 4 protein [Legionella dresdenensis]|uniref:Glycosyltransferase family 4 protein n=1 Tax=Legionella dresdenensis TaxID=450200 RepID=A0ABV8CCR6_9GAMM
MNKLNVLVLSFYYKPDLCAGSFRTTSLVEELKAKLPPDARIHVITSMPNRYHSHNVAAAENEEDGIVRITRIPIPAHKSGMLGQVRSFFVYFMGVLKILRKQKYDLVYATSSRLFTAFLGAIASKQQKAPVYMDIRDIFVDTIGDVMPKKWSKFFLPVLSGIEKFTFSSAARINLVSPGFLPYFQKDYSGEKFDFFTNGIDAVFLDAREKMDRNAVSGEGKKTVLYAGNIGEGQGLEKIIPDLARAVEEQYDFIVIGDGGRRKVLEEELNRQGVKNVTLMNPVTRQELINYYQKADILFLHLNAHNAFLKVLPSKVFEYAALGKPLLAGVSGYAKSFIESEIDNAAVFHPCDYQQAITALSKIKYSFEPRADFIAKYDRAAIMKKLSDSVLAVAGRL